MQNTTHYNLKKPDYTDFADIQDINDNMDTIDAELAAPTGDARDQVVSFTDADLDTGITSFPSFLTKIVSGMKLAKFLRDFKAGMAYVLHVGDLINNATCTESGKALDARMGKTLQDQITSLNDSLQNVGALSSAPATWTGNYTLGFQTPLTNYRFILLIGRYNYVVEAVVLIPPTAALGSRVRVVYGNNFAQIEFNSSGTSATMSGFTGYTDVLIYGVF